MEDLHYSVFDESSLLFDCYPGGNDTFIFCNRAVPRTDYKQVQALIRGRYPHFEQGG